MSNHPQHTYHNKTLPNTNPVIVGALGGSGTRVLVSLLGEAKVWMGRNDKNTLDSLVFRRFLAQWFDTIISSVIANEDVPPDALLSFIETVQIHRENIPEPCLCWGWKNPRNMWLIPFYAHFFPGLKFIHMVRDGREMAISNNHFLLEKHGKLLLGNSWDQNECLSQLRLWTLGNKLAQAQSIKLLGEENYLLIRYEDLCNNPRQVVKKLFSFIDVPLDESKLTYCTSLIKPSKRINEWRNNSLYKQIELDAETKNALISFHYLF